jgi:hypothetical protein
MRNFKLAIVGPTGSGKTVYLSTLWYLLRSLGQRGFHLEIMHSGTNMPDVEAKADLNRCYAMVANPAESFPDPTAYGDEERLTFQCRVHKDGTTFSAAEFTYLDYPGEALNPSRKKGTAENPVLENTLSEADLRIGLLDGAKIAELLKATDPKSHRWTLEDLPAITGRLNPREGERLRPAHFIISKWDLLTDRQDLLDNEKLERVVGVLSQCSDFQDFITDARKNGLVVRMIPVSAVGYGFATKAVDGNMVKTGSPLAPFFVEMPLACVLLDVVEQALAELQKDEESGAPQTLHGFFRCLLAEAGRQLRDAARNLDFGQAQLDAVSRALESPQRAHELPVQNELSALEYAVMKFQQLRSQLESTMPASLLSGAQAKK